MDFGNYDSSILAYSRKKKNCMVDHTKIDADAYLQGLICFQLVFPTHVLADLQAISPLKLGGKLYLLIQRH